MLKFIAIIDHIEWDSSGGGEDEISVKFLKAKTLDKAQSELAELMPYYGEVSECYMEDDEEFPVHSVRLLEIKEEHCFSVETWVKEERAKVRAEWAKDEAEEKAKELAAQEEKDRKEYERLQKKFANK